MKAKKIIIPVSIIAGIAVIGVAVAALGNAASSVTYADTIKIQEKTIENKISVSGTVESAKTQKVYSKLAYPVEKINVSVGDAVKKGDILCTIDTEELQQQILQQQASVDSSGLSSDYNLSDVEQKYAEALENYNNGKNSSIVAAERNVEQAEKNLEDAKRQESIGTGTTLPSNLQNAASSVESAKNTYENSVKAYEEAEAALAPENYPADVKSTYDKLNEYKKYLDIVVNNKFNSELAAAQTRFDEAQAKYNEVMTYKDIYYSGDIERATEEYQNAKLELQSLQEKYDEKNLKEQVKSLETQYNISIENLKKSRDAAKTNLESAKIAYERVQEEYKNTEKQTDSSVESYSIAVKNAEDALEAAKKDYERTVQQVESELASLKKQAEQQRTLSGLNDPQVIILENLKNKLEYAVITAPCDGIITAVNAEEGVAAAGSLFVIEDLSDLVVEASVGEYDIPYVAEGMTAVIRCDALDGIEYDGKVTEVAPTAADTVSMTTSAAVNYKIKTDIDGEDGKMLVGMSAKVNIISDKRENALTVTYDALTTDENGNDVIFIAEKDESGVYHAKLVQVEVGLETDYEIEIISDQISEGMLVLTNTAMLSDGDVVMINENETDAEQVTE
ncbi:MAG: efflux RND transporter periplasmic adaptor subunit [Oscillospiraceae bacterium]